MNIKQMISRSPLYLLTLFTFAVAPASAQTITHVPRFTFEGDSDGDSLAAPDFFGATVSGAGDVNGDGFADLAVGVFGDDNNGVDSGSARVFSGVDGSVLYIFDGESEFDRMSRVSDAGDVNGDGFDDLIVGATGDDNNGVDSGSARVFSGSDGSVLYTFFGDSPSDRFGSPVSGAGDVNGDGFDDLIVGARFSDNNGEDSGYARVFSGVDGSVLYNFDGDSPSDRFGTVSGAGDVNGDGFDDLIVGTATTSSGNVQVFSGFDGSVLYNFPGSSAFDRFGISVSGAGDVNGDGFADLIVGAPTADNNNGDPSGSAYVFSGVDGSVLYKFDGESTLDFFGTSVSDAGDVNGDGFDDLIVGVGDRGASGSARVFSGSDGSLLYQFNGNPGDRFGSSVSGAGDVNGDGLADFIVGSESGNSGYARLFVSQITLLGDCNLDGVVNFLDIPPFIAVLSSGGSQPEADVNESGGVDFLDIGPFIEILSGS